jgi:hypothetical protein
MRSVVILLFLAISMASCSEKASLNDDDERYVEITLAMMKTRAKVAQAGADSLQLRRSLDSVYKVFKIDSTEYVRMSVELAERPDHALLAYQTIRDSLGLK